MKNIEDFNVRETFYAKIYFSEKDAVYVDAVSGCIDFYAPLLLNDFGFAGMSKIKLIMFSDGDEMAKALGLNYTTPPMGVYYGGIINILSPSQWIFRGEESYIKERFVKEGPIIHELTHMLTDLKTNGNYPVWFSEGISLFYEHKYASFEWREDLRQASQNIALDELENNFRLIDESKAYRRSFDIIYNYIEENGEQNFQNQISKLKDGSPARDIFEKNEFHDSSLQ